MKKCDEESNNTKTNYPKILKLILSIIALFAGGFFMTKMTKRPQLRAQQQLESKSDQNEKVSNRSGSARGFMNGFLKGLHGGK
jgi:hypothetical protein